MATQPATPLRVLRAEAPPPNWEADYARDGFYVIPDALTDAGRDAVVTEIMEEPRTEDLLARWPAGEEGAPSAMTLRPWDTMCDQPVRSLPPPPSSPPRSPSSRGRPGRG